MSEAVVQTVEASPDQGTKCESPPAAAMPARQEPDPRARLHELAAELARSHNRRLIVEYLRLRRAVR